MEGLIAVTYRCNAKCRMCDTWQHPSKAEDEIRPERLLSLPMMSFTNITGGEPFLRKDLQEIVDILKPKTKRIVISTNGYLTDTITEFAKNNRDIGFRVSLEGLPAVSDELRGLKDGFDHGMRTLMGWRALGLKDIGFSVTVCDRSAKDLLDLFELSEAMGMEFATAVTHNSYYFHKYDNEFKDKAAIQREFERLINAMLKTGRPKNWFRAYFNYGIINYVYGRPRLLPCGAGTDVFFVDPYGEVRPCNGMEETMGNLKTKSFDEIWNSKEAGDVRCKVKVCGKNCWMIGTASPAIKKRLWIPMAWVFKNKIKVMMGKDVCFEK